MTTALSLSTLAALGGGVSVPNYNRASLSAGIVHFGVGNFHRAHQAVYLDGLFNLGIDHDWAILGAGVLPSDDAIRRKLATQDFLTTVVEQEANVSTARVIAPMVGFIPPADRAALITALADPAIRIVSLTITEGGYYIDPATGAFNPAHPDIAHDVANPENPSTVFGLIVAGLAKRRATGVTPFTVMSCDNVPHNGMMTRKAVAGLAQLVDRALTTWIEDQVTFPSAMVDRITPATTDRERQFLARQFSIADQCPVFCEEFKQWVLEDKFTAGRPALERVGVTFVTDVTPYENMKIRILNGGHAVIAYPAGLLDIHYVHEAMQHPLIRAYLAKVEREEIIPGVSPVPDTDLGEYYRLIERRFVNPKIGDTIRRLCLDGSNRQPKFIVPAIVERLKAGQQVTGLALESALWCRYCFGVSESGKEIPANDPNWERLRATSQAAKERPAAWPEMQDIYGDAGRSANFQDSFSSALQSLWTAGTMATLERYIGRPAT